LALGEQGEGRSLVLLIDFLFVEVEMLIFGLLLFWEIDGLVLCILIIKLI